MQKPGHPGVQIHARDNVSKSRKQARHHMIVISEKSQQWNDSYAIKTDIPEYRVAEDKYASGYMAGLKRQKRLKPYLN